MQPLRETNPPAENTTDMAIYAWVLKVLVSIGQCVELCQSLVSLEYPGMASAKGFEVPFFSFSLSLAPLLYLASSSASFANINYKNISNL